MEYICVMPSVRLIIKGKVQGVFYRHSTREKARALGLNGWVRNRPDGTVEAEASGSKERLESLIDWCKTGPPAARVESVQVDWLEQGVQAETERSGFAIH